MARRRLRPAFSSSRLACTEAPLLSAFAPVKSTPSPPPSPSPLAAAAAVAAAAAEDSSAPCEPLVPTLLSVERETLMPTPPRPRGPSPLASLGWSSTECTEAAPEAR